MSGNTRAQWGDLNHYNIGTPGLDCSFLNIILVDLSHYLTNNEMLIREQLKVAISAAVHTGVPLI